MSVTFEQVINNFMNGVKQDEDGAKSSTGTLKIQGDQLIHYWTPIAERCDGKIIVNITRYSLATGKLQKQLKGLIPKEIYVTVRGVEEGYKGSLKNFLVKK
jgi:hypothetical protein